MSSSIANLRTEQSSLSKATSNESLVDSTEWSLKDQLKEGSLWIYILIAIVVVVLIIYIVKDGMDKNGGDTSWWDQLAKYDWGSSTTLWGLLMVVGVVLFAWAACKTCLSFPKGDTRCYYVMGGFAVSMLAIVAMFSVMFSAQKDQDNTGAIFRRSSYIALFAAAIGFLTLIPMWKHRNARVAMIPYLVWVSAITILVWKMADETDDSL
jgi:tryptophan-rich sensory protein